MPSRMLALLVRLGLLAKLLRLFLESNEDSSPNKILLQIKTCCVLEVTNTLTWPL